MTDEGSCVVAPCCGSRRTVMLHAPLERATAIHMHSDHHCLILRALCLLPLNISTLEAVIVDAGRVPAERRTDYSARHEKVEHAHRPQGVEAIPEEQAEGRLGSFRQVG